MKALSVSLTLGTFLTLSRAVPLNNSVVSRNSGLCQYEREQRPPNILGGFTPKCDSHGNFLPQQCSGSTGQCWCVNAITGEEIPNTRTPPGTVRVNCDREYYCPYGWSRFGSQCLVFIDSQKTWAEAESYCQFERANLVSIHSPEEDHFVQALTRGDTYEFPQTWIGGNDAVQLSFWMWRDGSMFNYDNWSKDYTLEGKEHCLKMNYGFDRKWMDASCDDALPFVCAKTI